MIKNRTGRAALTVLTTFSVLTLVGCAGTSADAPASTPAAEATSTATPTPTPTPLAGAASPIWPTDPCQDTQLSAKVEDRPGLSEVGQEGFAIVLENTSEQACSYYGWPGVLMLGADGTQLISADTSGAEPLPGALAPGESAQMTGKLTAIGEYDCTPTTATTVRVLVTSDGVGPGIEAPSDFQVCGDARSDFSTGALSPAS